MPTCDVCGRLVYAACARCWTTDACGYCDRCYGCGQILCQACDTEPTPEFAYAGDRYMHPHNEIGVIPEFSVAKAHASVVEYGGVDNDG